MRTTCACALLEQQPADFIPSCDLWIVWKLHRKLSCKRGMQCRDVSHHHAHILSPRPHACMTVRNNAASHLPMRMQTLITTSGRTHLIHSPYFTFPPVAEQVQRNASIVHRLSLGGSCHSHSHTNSRVVHRPKGTPSSAQWSSRTAGRGCTCVQHACDNPAANNASPRTAEQMKPEQDYSTTSVVIRSHDKHSVSPLNDSRN